MLARFASARKLKWIVEEEEKEEEEGKGKGKEKS